MQQIKIDLVNLFVGVYALKKMFLLACIYALKKMFLLACMYALKKFLLELQAEEAFVGDDFLNLIFMELQLPLMCCNYFFFGVLLDGNYTDVGNFYGLIV